MPTLIQIKADALIVAATAAQATASANLTAATAGSDAAYAAIQSAVRAGGYDSFKIASGVVNVPARLRSWTAADGLSSTWASIGLADLVSAYSSAAATTTRRQNEADGLRYVLSAAQGLKANAAPEASDAEVLAGLQAMLASIQTSMAA